MRRCLLALTILLAAGCADKTPPAGIEAKPGVSAQAGGKDSASAQTGDKKGMSAQVGGKDGVPAPVAVAGAVGLGVGLGALALVALSGIAAASLMSGGH